jgi:hypothetical protein
MKIKVYDGTKQDRHLCPTCKHSHIIKGQRDHEAITRCRADLYGSEGVEPITIKFRVAECNHYQEQDDKQLNELQNKATYMYRLASGKWVGLHIGQLNDHAFMQALRQADGQKNRDVDKEAKEFLKAAAAKGD